MNQSTKINHYNSDSVNTFAYQVLSSMGCDDKEAKIVADHLVLANLTGHDSHGIGMLPLYGDQVKSGNLVPNQKPEFFDAVGAVTIVDAKRGFGHHMALLALDHAMTTVPQHKVAILGLRDSGHVSRVGTYSEYCASKGYVSMHMVNVVGHAPLVAPYGSREAAFSTNPISMATPLNGNAKPLLDLATSTVAFGKVREASNKGETMPPGCLLDHQGLQTTDPDPMALHREGALSAFGGHKGSGLGIFVELLAGALVSNETVASLEHIPYGVINNMLSIIIDPAAFYGEAALNQSTQRMIDYLKNKQPALGTEEVLIPGEPESITRTARLASGIPIDDKTISHILEVAARFNANIETLENTLSLA